MENPQTPNPTTFAEYVPPKDPPLKNPEPKKKSSIGKKLGASMIPFTPIAFTGEDMFPAILRTGVYATLTVLTWEKHRKISYVFAGALGISIASSLSAQLWSNVQ